MNGLLNQLNLSAQERRWVVVIGVVVFLVLNFLLVWPHFSDLKKVRAQLDTTRNTMQKWNKEITKDVEPVNGYKKQLAKLERQEGGGIMNQQVQLQNTVMVQARKTGVNVSNYQPVTSTHQDTNEFFEEQSIVITFDSQEPQLVKFLYDIGNDPSMIRVRQLHLRPADANRYRLRGEITLTANFAKQPASSAHPAITAPRRPMPINRPGGPGNGLSPNQKLAPGARPDRKKL